MVTKEQKEQIIAEYGRTAGDTGSPEVQIAILTDSSCQDSNLYFR